MKHRYTSLLLALLLTLPLAGCGGEPVSDDTVMTTDGASDEVSSESDESSSGSTLAAPDLLKTDMKGKVFTILAEDWWTYAPLAITDIAPAEMNGEILNDASFRRRSAISEKYNCVITDEHIVDDPANGTAKLLKSVTAGEHVYDIAVMRGSEYNKLLTSGSLSDLSLMPHFEPDSGYYDKASYDALSIAGSHYGVVSNITMNHNLLIFSAYFNKVMLDDFGIDNMYDTVRSGKWTIDRMYEIGKTVAADTDSDGLFTEKDRYGFTYIVDVSEGFLNASGINIAETSSDGRIVKTYNTETALTRMQHIFDILSDTATSFNVHKRSPDPNITNKLETGMFTDGNTLISLAGIYYAPQFRDMKDDFGIIPFPKYDESQADYISPVFSNPLPITVIPRTNADLESTGIILAEMSYRGYTELLPALYDTTLTGKCARDDDSVEMLDMIFSKTEYDIGMLFDFGGVRTKVRTIYQELDGNFASAFASLDTKVDKNIADLIEAVEENK